MSYAFDTFARAWEMLKQALPEQVRDGEVAMRFGFMLEELHDANHRLRDAVNHDTSVTAFARRLDDAIAKAPAATEAPSIEVDDAMALAFHHATTDGMIGHDDLEEIKTGLRAVFCNLATPAPAVGASDWWRKRTDEIELQVELSGSTEAMRCFTDMRTLLQSATAAVGASVQPVPASLSDERPPIKWPKARDVGRLEDMSPDGVLRVGLDNDGDAYVSVWTESGGGVEFCTSGNGGGKSPRTREALLALMVAMESDNEQDPRRDWWAKRNLASSTPTKGGSAA